MSVALLLWTAFLHSLGLCFVHLCFPSLPVCVNFIPAVRLNVVNGRWFCSVGKMLGKPNGCWSRYSLKSGTTSRYCDI